MKIHVYHILIFISLLSLSITQTAAIHNQQECNTNTCCCPFFDYTMKATTEISGTELTSIETDLAVPSSPTIEIDGLAPTWAILPFIENNINKNNPRQGILQPVLEWNFQHQTNQWTITPWYEDGTYTKTCGNTPDHCQCTDKTKSLVGSPNLVKHKPGKHPPSTKLYPITVPHCHNFCEPKHGPRITASPGDTIHFTLIKSKDSWTTTALNKNTNQQTSFQTTCIHPNDNLIIGFALEKQERECAAIQNHNGESFPGNIKFTNIKFHGQKAHTLRLSKHINPTAHHCFPWLTITTKNSADTPTELTFSTQPPSHKDEL